METRQQKTLKQPKVNHARMNPKSTSFYISGPMTGHKHFNYPKFDLAESQLNALGYTVLSPASMSRNAGFSPESLPADYDWSKNPPGFDFERCAMEDVKAVFYCDSVLMLSGWEHSKGARAEHALAIWLGKRIIYQVGGDTVLPVVNIRSI